jgi:hypothetical protein
MICCDGVAMERFGTLDKKRGIVNIAIRREGRKTYLSMDEAMVDLAVDLFHGDTKALGRWVQERVDEWDAARRSIEEGDDEGARGVPCSGLSRLIQREVVGLARRMLAKEKPATDVAGGGDVRQAAMGSGAVVFMSRQ